MTVLSRAVMLSQFGEPLRLERFPVPAAPPGGMVVASRYGGVCGTDVHLQQGHLRVPIPLVLGHEGLGTVHELGAGTATDINGELLREGDHVMWASSIACGACTACTSYREPTLCERRRTYGVNRSVSEEPALTGSWAEYICLFEGTTVLKLPEQTDPIAAMSLACAGPTMVHALTERRAIQLGETVVVQGSGPVGLAAAALAQLAGAGRVIIVGGPAERLRVAKEVGVGDHYVDIISAVDPQDALNEVIGLTGGKGADLVIECAGLPAAVGQGLRLARRGGAYLVVGQYTDGGDSEINPHQIVYRQLEVIGSWAFTGAHLAKYLRLLPRLTERFDLAKLVTTYPLQDFGSAVGDVACGSVLKAVLVS